jgi:hypothetical protein
MNRRTLSICLVLCLLFVLSLASLSWAPKNVSAQVASTATLTATPTASTGPDLIVTRVYWSPSRPAWGSYVTFYAVIQNVGNVATPAGVIHDVRFGLSGVVYYSLMSTTYTQSILPGASATLVADTTWTTNVLHNYTISGTVDSGARIAEMNENNNSFTAPTQLILEPTQPAPTLTRTFTPAISLTPTLTRSLTPTPTTLGLPDLTAISIVEFTYTAPTSTPNAQGCWPSGPYNRIGLRVTVQNIGGGNAGAFVLDLNGQQQTISGLASGQTLAVDFTGMTLTRTRTATVDITGLVAESNETNNVYTLALSAATPTRTGTVPPQICVTRTPTPTITPTGAKADLLYPATPNWIWDPNAYDSAKACYNYIPGLVWNVQVKNGGATAAGSFVVNQNYSQQQTVSGLPAGQTITLYFPFRGARPTPPAGQPTLSPGYDSFMADYTNLVVESNETNNTVLSFPMVAFTPTPNGGPTRVFCNAGTPTPTPTITLSPTRTNTPTIGPSLTPTRTPTPTPTCGACSALRVQVLSSGADNTQQTAFNFKVVNLGPAQSNISVRIYFTLDGIQAASNYVMEKYYDQSGAATISGPTLASGSNYYFTVNYGTATLGTGSSWEFQTVLHLADWSSNYSGVNDWWHTTGTLPTSYTDWTTIPAYANGTRVWGSVQP